MKSNPCTTVVFQLLTFGMSLLLLVGLVGCRAPSRFHHPAGILGQGCQASPTNGNCNQAASKVRSQPGTGHTEQAKQAEQTRPRGILAELENKVFPKAAGTFQTSLKSEGNQPAVSGPDSQKEVRPIHQDRSAVSPIQSSRRSILTTSSMEDVSPNSPTQATPSMGLSADIATTPDTTATDSEDRQKNSNLELLDETSSSISVQPKPSQRQLKSLPKFEFATVQDPLIRVAAKDAAQKKIQRPPTVEEATTPTLAKAAVLRKFESSTPVPADFALANQDQPIQPEVEGSDRIEFFAPSRRQPIPSSLPHATQALIQRSRITEELSSPIEALVPQPVSPVANTLDQDLPLELQLRIGQWPDRLPVDQVSRAYEIYQSTKSKTVYRDLSAEPSSEITQLPNSPKTSGQLVSHRRAIRESEPTEGLPTGQQRLSIPEAHKQHSGLILQATPRSTSVPLSPLVTMVPGANSPRTNSKLGAPPSAAEEIQPKYWPSIPDSHQLLPTDEIGPIIDLPVSDSLRRLTVRPDESAAQPTIDR